MCESRGQEVGLHQPEVEGILLPRGVGEPAVLGGGSEGPRSVAAERPNRNGRARLDQAARKARTGAKGFERVEGETGADLRQRLAEGHRVEELEDVRLRL